MFKGGYIIIDFCDKNLTPDGVTVTRIPEVYKSLLSNNRKLVRVSGLTVDGAKYPDTSAMVEVVDGGYNIITPLFRFFVTADGITASVVTGGGGGKLYRHKVLSYQDQYYDASFTIVIYSASDVPLTAETIAEALETGMIGAFNTPMVTLAPATVDKAGSQISIHYFNGSAYDTISIVFDIAFYDTVTEV